MYKMYSVIYARWKWALRVKDFTKTERKTSFFNKRKNSDQLRKSNPKKMPSICQEANSEVFSAFWELCSLIELCGANW